VRLRMLFVYELRLSLMRIITANATKPVP